MALKPTIFKFRISLSDLDRNVFESLSLTVAQHPSETVQRMLARVVAYLIHYDTSLEFTRGLSSTEEPDVWRRTLDNQITLWVDVGEPSSDRVKKASRMASKVLVYSFNTKSDSWWEQNRSKLSFDNVSILRFDFTGLDELSKLIDRTIDCSITISEMSAFIATSLGECEVDWRSLSG